MWRLLAAQVFFFALPAGSAWAIPADSPDDICAPAANPCIVDHIYEVSAPLDFGLRTVRVQGAGRLVGQPDIILDAGQLDIAIGGDANAIDTASGGAIEVTVYRACSVDGTTRCLDDAECAPSLGTCSAGNTGTIVSDGGFNGAGAEPSGGSIVAAGDITLMRRATFAATGIGITGPDVTIASTMGSVTADVVSARSGTGQTAYYDIGYGGYIQIRAQVDVEITGNVDAWGAGLGGIIDIEAGRDILLTSQITNNAGRGSYASGGGVTLTAGRDLVIGPGDSGDAMQEINTDGGGGLYIYGYGYGTQLTSGYGGYQDLTAGEDITVAESGRLHSRGGPGARGGNIDLLAHGSMTVDGHIRSVGPPPLYSADAAAAGGYIDLFAEEGLTLGEKSILDTASGSTGGTVDISADGAVVLDGKIDVRGTGALGYYNYPEGGSFYLDGLADVSIGGSIRAGGRWRGAVIEIDVCRLELTETGVIDHSFGQPNPDNGYNDITVHESMITAPGSKLLADSAGGRTVISYRDTYKPPVLNGTVSPAALLNVNPSLSGCPVCGNFEIDAGESCDDGNTTSGDGCRADCQDEGCLAQSPGFPSTPMCDDGDACTLDHCNATTHSCTNVISCEEGVQCTVDACASGACQHTPDDSLCDDGEECTDDLCNPLAGCAHANLTGTSCDDSDFCTVTEACDGGHCIATDGAFTVNNKVTVSLRSGVADDRMKATLNLPLTAFTANPTATGARVVATDAAGATIYDAVLPAALWEDTNGTGQKFRFRDASGINSASIKRNEAKGVAKTLIKVNGTDLPGAAGQSYLSVSLLFGTDPGADECLTGRAIPCTASATKLKCSD